MHTECPSAFSTFSPLSRPISYATSLAKFSGPAPLLLLERPYYFLYCYRDLELFLFKCMISPLDHKLFAFTKQKSEIMEASYFLSFRRTILIHLQNKVSALS